MKKIAFSILLFTISVSVNCQNYYYVFLTDKNNVDFNPYQYFDQKAIERRILNGISLYDKSDFPVNQNYINQIVDLSDEYVGESRWFNMVMISASDENIAMIRNFPFVKNSVQISDGVSMKLAEYQDFDIDEFFSSDNAENKLSDQLISLQGEYFVKNNLNGKGVRIAVFDGGFPKVDTHEAFEHLRKNNQIVNTWNFPRKKEDVYGWSSHGTMVLSCIAGIKKDGTMLGLATGAEFLLARTEVETEPKKEEFWWLQAVEWADKNGADVINSSLGYGIDRHYFEELDGKTTIVTKAANMAASKGILVCNSAGNEGSDRKWLKIIAPADADSILTVGGINADLTHFSKIFFSSYGPTADGRMKPNVVAFGYANVASPSKNGYRSVHGTSFSSPLIAGFVACAWQTNRNRTAMQLKDEIEKSASLYPYFDYAYGYGIPQASYFTENQKPEIEKTFEITSNNTTIIITPFVEKLDFLRKKHYLFYNIQNEDGTLEYYALFDLYNCYTRDECRYTENCPALVMATDSTYKIGIIKDSEWNNKILNVFLNGYFESYKIEDVKKSQKSITNYRSPSFIDVKNQKTSKWGYKAKHFMTGYVAYSMFVPPSDIRKEWYNFAKSYTIDIGIRYKYNVCKWYAIGGNLEFGITEIHLKKDQYYFHSPIIPLSPKYNKWVGSVINLEFFQRFNLGVTSFGNIYFDLGIYGSANVSGKQIMVWDMSVSSSIWGTHQSTYKARTEFFGYGIRARLGYGPLAIFAQYGLPNNELHNTLLYDNVGFHVFSLGIELSVPY